MPVPSFVLLLAVVGEDDLLQQTPLAVTFATPSVVSFTPPVAVVWVMLVIELVVTVGCVKDCDVVKVTSLP